MYQVTNHLSDNKRFIKKSINWQTMYQPICQLTNQVSHNVQVDKPFINYMNHVLITDESFVTSHQPFINFVVSNYVLANKTYTR